MIIGILGANGFVGRNLCLKYLSENNKVIAFYNKNYSLIPNGCAIVSMNEGHNYKLDCLVVSIGSHNSTHEEFLEHYLLLNDAIKIFKFNKIIFISSVEVYGNNESVISEESCFNNPNIYGLAKITQEFLIKSVKNSTIIRATYLYGNGMNGNSLLPIWMNKAKKDKEIIVFGSGERKQDYLHIDDFVEICRLATMSKINNDTVIAATGESITNAALASEICKNVSGCIIKYKDEDYSSSYQYDVSNIKLRYNWRPKTTIKDWIKEALSNENFNL